MNWENKIVIITGAGTGIGKATKDLLREKGSVVYNLDLAMPEDEQAPYHIPCDVRNRHEHRKDAVQQHVERCSRRVRNL